MSEAMLIPLRNRAREIVGHAIVDAADVEALSAYRWHLNDKGYAKRTDHGRVVYMHRQILGLERGSGNEGDHINRNRLDNRRANLRIVTRRMNNQNVTALEGSSSQYRGVSWNKAEGRWHAYARVDGRLHFLGKFTDEKAAGRAAAEFRAAHMPGTVESIPA